MRQKLSPEDNRQIAKLYTQGFSSGTISKQFQVSSTRIQQILKVCGVETRKAAEYNRRHSINQAVFDCLAPESEYWIGFLFADGCITRQSCLGVGLCKKDLNHLEKLLQFLGSSHKISHYKTSVSFNIACAEVCNALRRHWQGTKKPERMVPDYLLDSIHFWRGVVDADGTIGVYSNCALLSLCGYLEPMLRFKKFAESFQLRSPLSVNHSKSIYTVQLNGCDAVKVLETLYLDSPVHLQRKYELSMSAIRHESTKLDMTKGENHVNAKLSEEQVKEILASSDHADALASRFHVVKRTIYDIKSRKTWKHLSTKTTE